jgi:hypothetical protein
MLQWLYTYVAKVYYQCFIYVFWMYIASVFIWMWHMFYTYITCVLSVLLRMIAMFSSFFQVFQKHEVFHLPSNVCCNCRIWMFQKQTECCISPRLLLHRFDVSFSRQRQGIKSEGLTPSPPVARAAQAPRGTRGASVRTSGR